MAASTTASDTSGPRSNVTFSTVPLESTATTISSRSDRATSWTERTLATSAVEAVTTAV